MYYARLYSLKILYLIVRVMPPFMTFRRVTFCHQKTISQSGMINSSQIVIYYWDVITYVPFPYLLLLTIWFGFNLVGWLFQICWSIIKNKGFCLICSLTLAFGNAWRCIRWRVSSIFQYLVCLLFHYVLCAFLAWIK